MNKPVLDRTEAREVALQKKISSITRVKIVI